MQKMDAHANDMDGHIKSALEAGSIQSGGQEIAGSSQRVSNGRELIFTLFPKLAVEIQMLIWEFSCPRQVLNMVQKKPTDGLPRDLLNTTPVPVTLRVCQLSRKIALKMYPLMEGSHLRRPMYYNKLRDVVLFQDLRSLHIHSGQTLSNFGDGPHNNDQGCLGHLAFRYNGPFGICSKLAGPIRQKTWERFVELGVKIQSYGLSSLQSFTIIRSSSASKESPSQVVVDYTVPDISASENSLRAQVLSGLRKNEPEG